MDGPSRAQVTRRGTLVALVAFVVTVLGAGAFAGCSETGDPSAPARIETPPPARCEASDVYPSAPYGSNEGETLAPLALRGIDETGAGATIELASSHAPCGGASARVLVVRVVAGFCGTCQWQNANLEEVLSEGERKNVRVVDVLVRDEDNDPPEEASAKTWAAKATVHVPVAIDPEMSLVVRGAPLPRVLVVDPRTMKVRKALDDPPPEAITDAVRAVVSEIGAPLPPPRSVPPRVDGRFDRKQWGMIKAFHLAGGPPRDPTNRVGDDDNAAALGQILFDDKLLSPSGLVSCERCHEKGRAFTDGSETATGGVRGATRNTPSVVLAGWARWQLWDGRADSLWMQALLPIENENEMASSRLFVAHRIFAEYKFFYERVFGAMPPLDDLTRFPASGKPGDPAWEAMPVADRDLVTKIFVDAGKSIAAFERSFRNVETPMEKYIRGDLAAFDDKQKEGLVAFFDVGCAQCHWGNRLTDDAFHTMRFPTGRDDLVPDLGRDASLAGFDVSDFASDGRWSDAKVSRHKKRHPGMLGAFKTPPVRGVAVTGPWGHGGSVPSLEMAVDLHRTRGMPEGSRLTVGAVDPWVVPFDAAKVSALVALMGTMALGNVR